MLFQEAYSVNQIVVIELRGVQFGLKSYAWFQNWTSSIWSHKDDFRPKLHDNEVHLPAN